MSVTARVPSPQTAFRMACALKVRIVSSTSQTYMTLFPAFCSQSQAMYHRLSTTIDHSNHQDPPPVLFTPFYSHQNKINTCEDNHPTLYMYGPGVCREVHHGRTCGQRRSSLTICGAGARQLALPRPSHPHTALTPSPCCRGALGGSALLHGNDGNGDGRWSQWSSLSAQRARSHQDRTCAKSDSGWYSWETSGRVTGWLAKPQEKSEDKMRILSSL